MFRKSGNGGGLFFNLINYLRCLLLVLLLEDELLEFPLLFSFSLRFDGNFFVDAAGADPGKQQLTTTTIKIRCEYFPCCADTLN